MRLAFHPNGRLLAAGIADNSITLWDAARGGPGRYAARHTDRAYSMSFSPNGEEILTSSFDGKRSGFWSQRGERSDAQGP